MASATVARHTGLFAVPVGPLARPVTSLYEPSNVMGLTRAAGVWFLLAVILFARFGVVTPDGSLPVVLVLPGLVITTIWPLLVLAAAAGLDVWRWVDPWDTLARAAWRDDEDLREPAACDVRWAGVTALAVAWYVGANPLAREPRTFAAGLCAYTIAMVAGSLLLGRRRWLNRVEVFGLFLSWVVLLRRGRLMTWVPPRGATLVLGILMGGAFLGEIRTASWWGLRDLLPYGWVVGFGALIVCCAVPIGLIAAGERTAARRGAPGSVIAACVPLTAAVIIAFALTNSVGLLAIGSPLGALGRLLTQLALLVAGGVAGAFVAARRTHASDAVEPAVMLSCIVVMAGLQLVMH